MGALHFKINLFISKLFMMSNPVLYDVVKNGLSFRTTSDTSSFIINLSQIQRT